MPPMAKSPPSNGIQTATLEDQTLAALEGTVLRIGSNPFTGERFPGALTSLRLRPLALGR